MSLPASPETLMKQAGYTADFWLKQAIDSIDEAFGKGYAKDNPELVAGFLVAASNDQIAAYLKGIGDDIDSLANALCLNQ
ncbi:hypothetical protein I6Y99_004930 [Vibrio parahaemolyticus]|uniref:hypothetical protein n=1 Tax=Vibrio TaxID=662 RepID=UPI00046F1725|nr:hypothetical protein [Vibrio parahaemolyticus]EGQ7810862.1 hypothetical protein [Vibrio parahaemolyticus]MBE4804683.1 hypothetical protein [Vibrio parahaemolyticus]MCZ5940776.1 hypothetical protein [Vibrio parahaemolyticus]MCZ6314298.1 hypothetical protein [Vibrio parahaemolyticus]MDF4628348.1 hypothetical protein [Vibrio parahaemolyticus]